MTKPAKLVPKRRFKEFKDSDAWEQRKVTELGEVYIGLVTTMTAHYTNEGALLIRNSDIKDGKFEFNTEPIYLDIEFAEQNKSRMHKSGDVITVHTGDVGTSAVITENEANSIGFATIVTRPNQDILDSQYLSTFLNTEKHKVWAVQMSTGDGRTNYNLRDYTELVVPVPELEEQKKIGEYLSQFDNLITLHQRKLGEISNKVIEKNVGLKYVETFTNSAEHGIISQKDYFNHSISKIDSLEGYYIVQNEDFVYNPRISVTAPVGPINRNKLGRNGVMSPLYTVFRPYEVDNTYLEYFFKSRCWHLYMIFNGDSGARSDRFSIKDDLFFQMPVLVPYIDEQRKVGEYMVTLDNLITLHQRKLEKLQNIKKAYLNEMFV